MTETKQAGLARAVTAPSQQPAMYDSNDPATWSDAHAAGRVVRGLQEEKNPAHRLRVEHNKHTLLIHLSNEDGDGWTTIALDRATREWSIAQRLTQLDAAKAAFEQLYI